MGGRRGVVDHPLFPSLCLLFSRLCSHGMRILDVFLAAMAVATVAVWGVAYAITRSERVLWAFVAVSALSAATLGTLWALHRS
ncbi:hypothetical protein Pisl_1276 [Pyrobaculum islandicum DSM 4184]|uniref:Uncharacterized protein n=2 Tax=Pyrobaculum islandicum TaxID=2277 RepID=A1RU08_PYRIL|nr:hypothetical protein Pisl_1276 [Pyrobaculum islandicum DSM 4184]